MDPNETLRRLRELAAEIPKLDMESLADHWKATELAELFEALDGWISKGGFLPAAWQSTRDERPCELCGGSLLAEHRDGCKATP